MQHYFSSDPMTEHDERTFTVKIDGATAEFTTDAGVFSRAEMDFGSRLLVETVYPHVKGEMLDVGCGWGAMSVMMAKLCPGIGITMSDVNKRAVGLALSNAKANGIAAKALVSDGYESIEGKYDVIITNPPIRAGNQTVYRILDGAKDFLAPGGKLYLVIRKEQGAPSAMAHLKEVYSSVELLERKKGYWILACGV